MQSIEYVRTLVAWAFVWMAVFVAWFEIAPRAVYLAKDRRRH